MLNHRGTEAINISAATSELGSKVIFENDAITVWDVALMPGEETALHTHTKSYMWHAIQGGPLDCEDAHGNDLGVF